MTDQDHWRPPSANPATPQPLRVAEPTPRIAPTSSGFSVEKLPPANAEEIRKQCQYYESKVAGKYSVNSLAERYVRQLSRDVQAMLPGVDRSTKIAETRLRQLKSLIADWQQEFSVLADDDGDMLTPKQLKQEMVARAQRIRQLEAALAQAAAQHAEEMGTLGTQLAKYHEVAKASHEFQEGARRAEMKAALTQLRTAHAAELAAERAAHAAALEEAQRHHRSHRARSTTRSRAGSAAGSDVAGAATLSAAAAADDAADDESDELASMSVGSEEFEALQDQCDELRRELHDARVDAESARQLAAATLAARETELGEAVSAAQRSEAKAKRALAKERRERQEREAFLQDQIERMKLRVKALRSGEAEAEVRRAEARADRMVERVRELELHVETLRGALGPHAPN